VDRAAADIEWQRRKAIVEQSPDDWRAWFLLAVAYDNARDRKQARAAARHAIELFKQR
jgi:Flp pilus assembly protein TadD